MKFTGIDIAKDTFVAAYPVLNGYQTKSYTNDAKGVKKFIASFSNTEHHWNCNNKEDIGLSRNLLFV